MKKCLVIELWWIGDATLMTPVVQGLQADGWDITVLAKPQSRLLLQNEYPAVHWIEFDAPWTVFRGKYRLWRWPWLDLLRVLRDVRRGHFDAAVSIRQDPRDHLLLWLAGVPRRVGFVAPIGSGLLNEVVPNPKAVRHRTEDWWLAQMVVSPTAMTFFPPHLEAEPKLKERYRELFAQDPRPVLALHCGARNAVRRWPERYLRELVLQLRGEFDFQLVVFPDLDDYGRGLADLAQHTLSHLGLDELKASLSCATVFLGNDSGPAHLADALGLAVIAIFGPGDPHKMHPFGRQNLIVMRDICPYHPCSDYCRFPEPYCLTQLTPATVGREIRHYLVESGLLPQRTAPAPHLDPATPTS